MARPTDEKKDKTVKLRISADLYDELAKKGTNLSETIRNILKNADFSVPQNQNNEKTPQNNVPQNKIPSKSSAKAYDLDDLTEMVEISGLTMEKFFAEVTELMENGSFDLSKGKVETVNPSWATQFEETCHDLCIPVEKAAESAVKALKKGQI